jgi:phosphoribosylformylglycinamidine synthase PurS subunit
MKEFLVRVVVEPKPELLDPQGQAVERALNELGLKNVSQTRVGKCITFRLKAISASSSAPARHRDRPKILSEPCDRTLLRGGGGAVRAAVVVFPGSNCDHDTYYVLKELVGVETDLLWYRQTQLDRYDLIVLPGGFSYGDYLRAGAIARFAPVVQALPEYIEKQRGIVLGICNGFQILTEAGLLPGALTKNLTLFPPLPFPLRKRRGSRVRSDSSVRPSSCASRTMRPR